MSPAWSSLTDEVRAALAAKGLDIVAPLRLRWYNDVAPGTALIKPMSGVAGDDALVLLVGNSRALWPAFCAAHDSDAVIGESEHPVDTYVMSEISAAVSSCSTPPRVFHSHDTTPGNLVAIQRMAQVAGVAHLDEKCHLSIHPNYGPWIALRAAVVFDDLTGPSENERPGTPLNPLATDTDARERVDVAFTKALEGYDDPSTTLERWQRWVAVRDAVAPVKHAERYYDDQVLYHYNCQTAGSERTRIRDGLRAYRKKV
ncbi:hypothetical protein OAD67_01630 [bacterium]|nr:hypothetical protein [bacterium]